MANHTATCAVILSSMLLGAPALAGPAINKCISASGAITITDEACPANTRSIKLVNATVEPESETPDDHAGLRTTSVERYTSAPMPLRFAPPMRSPAPTRGLSPDKATLKAAKANLQLFDIAAQRAQRVAGFP